MPLYRNVLIILLLLVSTGSVYAQQAAAVDSMKRGYAAAKTVEEKVYWLDLMSRTLMNVNLKQADSVGQKLIEVAEESRDRKLMATAYMSNGTRCSYFAGSQNFAARAIEYLTKAYDIAKHNRLDDQAGAALLTMAAVNLAIPDKDKALSYLNQAFPLISGLTNDSLKTEVQNLYGNVHLARNDKILALRHYLTALRLAEDTKNPALLRNSNIYLSSFYSSIGDYDRAIDYYMKAMKKLDEIKEKNAPYMKAVDLNSIGNLYAKKKNHSLAITYFERSLAMADSLKFSNLKMPAYTSLLNQYLRMDKPAEALAYFNSTAGNNLKKFLVDFGFSAAVDQAYAVIYTELGKYDSAKYYFERSTAFFETAPNPTQRMNYYAQLGLLYKKTGENEKGIEFFLKVKEIAEETDQLEIAERASKQLDTLYTRLGNFQLASKYNSVYHLYKDSVDKLNKEKELAQVEAADEQLRLVRLEKEREEAKRKRFNIQYLAITIGIAALFIAMVMLGMFRVSRTTIKMIGFFTFIMFFEFIFLIFKKNIYSITQGEPWKDLLFMIGLAAILLPLHHWLEHKVIHYLTSHNRLTEAGSQLRTKLFKRGKTADH